MARQDYSEEPDFYTQDFERGGVVSIWLTLERIDAVTDTDTLQDLCGVGYYRLSDQESWYSQKPETVRELLRDISYSKSFVDAATQEANRVGMDSAYGIVLQFDFAYDPAQVLRPIAADPVFLGTFSYQAEPST